MSSRSLCACETPSRISSHAHPQTSRPDHVITFIRPKPKQSPLLATFVVPLNFNKLDMRDYLWHAYNVKVTAVRSFINEQAVESKGGGNGQIYRPRSQKMMIAELAKPFVWPKPLSGSDLEEFDNYLFKKVDAQQDIAMKKQKDRAKGIIPLRPGAQVSSARRTLGAQVSALLSGSEVWKNNVKLDERWTEIEKADPKTK